MALRAAVYLSYNSMPASSIGESFHCRSGSLRRCSKRSRWFSCDTVNHSLNRLIPLLTSDCSNAGTCLMNSAYSSSVQNPITRSTPARLYHERSNSTISPADGRCATYRWKYHCVRSASVGLARATVRAPRGLRCSVKRLIAPPLPAASRPSNNTTTRSPRLLHVALRLEQLDLEAFQLALVVLARRALAVWGMLHLGDRSWMAGGHGPSSRVRVSTRRSKTNSYSR